MGVGGWDGKGLVGEVRAGRITIRRAEKERRNAEVG